MKGMEITSIIDQAQSAEKQKLLIDLNKEGQDYTVVGIIDLNYIPSRVNLYLISGSVILLPIAGLFLRW